MTLIQTLLLRQLIDLMGHWGPHHQPRHHQRLPVVLPLEYPHLCFPEMVKSRGYFLSRLCRLNLPNHHQIRLHHPHFVV